MSILTLNQRPFVVFDPAKPEHRRAAHQFATTRTWGKCEFRFAIDDESTNLIDMINRRLLDWYMKNEFKKSKRRTIKA